MDRSRRADMERLDKRMKKNVMQARTVQKVVGVNPKTGRPIVSSVQEEFYNQRLDKQGKENAARTKAALVKQSKDKQLTRLRNRLIKAAQAGDKAAELRIAAKIKLYEGQRFEDYS